MILNIHRYLIDYDWLQTFYEYIGIRNDNQINCMHRGKYHAGGIKALDAIDNSKLVVDCNDSNLYNQFSEQQIRFAEELARSNSGEYLLRPDIEEDKDYAILSQEQWDLLSEWYGGGPRLKRKLISGRQRVELHPLQLWISKESDPKRKYPVLVSRSDTVHRDDLANLMLTKLSELSPSNSMHTCPELKIIINGIEYPMSSQINIPNFSCILVKDLLYRKQLSPASFKVESPVSGPHLSSNNCSLYSSSDEPTLDDISMRSYTSDDNNLNIQRSQNSLVPGRGAVGLYNIGNTCFLNSAVQCLSNTEALTRYFLESRWQQDLNEENPLGMSGLLAEAYCRLLNDMWGGFDYFAASPRELKAVIARFAPHFSGYLQHDAQEFLSFLLDGLHEDLNRVRSKPQVEIPSGDGANDNEIAQISWQRHRARNDSVLVDLFGGQYRSELVCPVTGRRSVTFDPFNCLTLQLPQSCGEIHVQVCLHRCPTALAHALRLTFVMPSSATYHDLRMRVASDARISAEKMIFADVISSRFFEFYEDSARVVPAGGRNRIAHVHAYETPVNAMDAIAQLKSSQLGPGDNLKTYLARSNAEMVLDSTRDQESGMKYVRDQESGMKYVFLAAVHRRPRKNYYRQIEMEAFASPIILAVPKDAATGRVKYAELWGQVCAAASRLCGPQLAPGGPARTAGPSNKANSDVVPWEWEDRIELRKVQVWRHSGIGEDLEQDAMGGIVSLDAGDTLGIDWTLDGLDMIDSDGEDSGDRYDSGEDLDEEVTGHRKNEAESVDLVRLLQAFSAPEILSDSNSWFSPFCRQHVRATKTISVWSAPAHLVIHLKRFAATGEEADTFGGFGLGMQTDAVRDKLDTLVKFPMRGLDMRPFVRGPTETGCGLIYDLYGVVNHFGGAGYGHYTACCLSPADGKWRRFDDSDVEIIDDPETGVVTKAAYLLFYRLRG